MPWDQLTPLNVTKAGLQLQPCSQLMRSWSLLDSSLVSSSPSEQRKQPFPLPAGSFAAAAPAEGRPPSPLTWEAGLPPWDHPGIAHVYTPEG